MANYGRGHNRRFQVIRERRPPINAEAERKRFRDASATTEGHFAKGQLVRATDGKVYRVTTIGFRYHEDVSNRLYGLEPARAPKEYKATEDMRQLIDYILAHGTQERGSRSGKPETQRDMPSSKREAEWHDGKPNSYASFPSVILYEGNYLKAVRPNYDDASTVAWIQSEKLAKQFREANAISPRPFYVQEATVRRRPDKGELTMTSGQSGEPSPTPTAQQESHTEAHKVPSEPSKPPSTPTPPPASNEPQPKPTVAPQQTKPTENKSEPTKSSTAAYGTPQTSSAMLTAPDPRSSHAEAVDRGITAKVVVRTVDEWKAKGRNRVDLEGVDTRNPKFTIKRKAARSIRSRDLGADIVRDRRGRHLRL